jgi:hypothetical protein
MRKIIFFICALVVLLNISCINHKDTVNNPNSDQEIKIEGKIEKGIDNLICIVKNWESKSRVSYYIYGKYKEELSKKIGKIVKVSGIVINDKSPWTKDFMVYSIIEIKD